MKNKLTMDEILNRVEKALQPFLCKTTITPWIFYRMQAAINEEMVGTAIEVFLMPTDNWNVFDISVSPLSLWRLAR